MVYFNFPQNFNRIFCKQTMKILIRHCMMQCLIWVCTHCLCPVKGMLGPIWVQLMKKKVRSITLNNLDLCHISIANFNQTSQEHYKVILYYKSSFPNMIHSETCSISKAHLPNMITKSESSNYFMEMFP